MNKDIEVIDRMIKGRSWEMTLPRKEQVYNEEREVLIRVKSALEAREKAEGVLPEKKNNRGKMVVGNFNSQIPDKIYSIEYFINKEINNIINLCTPVVAKLIKERDEWEDKLRRENKSWANRFLKLQAELSRIKEIGVEEMAVELDRAKVYAHKDRRTLNIIHRESLIEAKAIHKLYGGK